MSKAIIQNLRRVKNRLEKHGWIKGWGNPYKHTAKTCIVGAVRGEVGGENTAGRPVIQALNAAKKGIKASDFKTAVNSNKFGLADAGNLINFNDSYGTKKRDIIALVNKAMKLFNAKDKRQLAKVTAVQATPNGHLKVKAKHGGKELSFTLNFQEWPKITCEQHEIYAPKKIIVSKKGMIHVTMSSFSVRVDLKKHPEVTEKMAERAFERLDNMKKGIPVISKALAMRLKGKMYIAPKAKQEVKPTGMVIPMKVPVLV
jgi:hypothetical protein